MSEAVDLDLGSAETVSVATTDTATEVLPLNLLAGMTGRRKAAIFILALGKEYARPVLAQFTDAELEDLLSEIARIDEVSPEVAEAVFAEFTGSYATGLNASHGGADTVKNLLVATLGAEKAEEMLERMSQVLVEQPFSFAQNLDARQLLSFLSDEHPQTIALVLAHLPAGQASSVLAGLAPDLQSDVAHRIAVMDRTSPEAIRQVEASLARRLDSMGVASNLSAVGGLQPLVNIINRADRGTEKLILEGLEQRDSELAEQVRAKMFMFEDLVTLEDQAVQLVLRRVSSPDLAAALKGVNDDVRTKVMRNLSDRAAQNLADEIDILGKVRARVVEEAQASIVRVIRELEEAGEIIVGRGDEDAFVD